MQNVLQKLFTEFNVCEEIYLKVLVKEIVFYAANRLQSDTFNVFSRSDRTCECEALVFLSSFSTFRPSADSLTSFNFKLSLFVDERTAARQAIVSFLWRSSINI